MIENLLQNAQGTFLKINIKEIQLNLAYESLMYTVQAQNEGDKNTFTSSVEI